MTKEQWEHLADLLEKAIRGDEQAISEVCEFIDKHLKQETMNRLSSAGVVGPVDEAYPEVLLTVRLNLSRLKVVDAFESWPVAHRAGYRGPISATLCEVPKTQATRASGDGET